MFFSSDNFDLQEIFQELIDYTKYHFESEEKIWEKYFNDLENEIEHKKSHENFVIKLQNFIDKDHTDIQVTEELLDFLVQWLVSHILESDRFMAYQVVSLKEGYSQKESELIAKEKMDGHTKRMINLIMDIYRTLSHNTILLMREIKLQSKIEKQLIEQEYKYRTLMQLSSDGIFLLNFEGKLIEYNIHAKNLLGYEDEEMKKLYIYDWDLNYSKDELKEMLKKTPFNPIYLETRHKTKDGKAYDASITAVRILLNDKNYIYASVRDITQYKKKEQEIRDKLQKLIDTQNSIVVLTDGKNIKFANRSFLEFFACKDLEQFLENNNCIYEKFLENENFFSTKKSNKKDINWIDSLLELNGRDRVVLMNNYNSITHAFSISLNKYEDDTYIVDFSDISDTVSEKLQFEKEALIDQLTTAYNRLYFNQKINSIINTHEKNRIKTGIIFFDIDYFKKINDTYGHDFGDKILNEIAVLVKDNIREKDYLFRWGGEEFILITSTNEIDNLYKNAENLRVLIERHTFLDNLHLTCSFGCAIHENNTNLLDSINNADKAMYIAKKDGRNKVVNF